eukprot:14194061-Alexandrium_andersonii.AAC.1
MELRGSREGLAQVRAGLALGLDEVAQPVLQEVGRILKTQGPELNHGVALGGLGDDFELQGPDSLLAHAALDMLARLAPDVFRDSSEEAAHGGADAVDVDALSRPHVRGLEAS